MNIVEKARIFAISAHTAVGQFRKYTNEPYWVHCEDVANIVASVPGATDAMIAAGWLHDTVEDTAVTIELIQAEFGDEVAELVGWLTDVSKPEDGNRAARKALDRAHTACAPASAQTVKLADLISNTTRIILYDADFAVVYLREKRLLLDVMTRGDAALLAQAREHIGEE